MTKASLPRRAATYPPSPSSPYAPAPPPWVSAAQAPIPVSQHREVYYSPPTPTASPTRTGPVHPASYYHHQRRAPMDPQRGVSPTT